MGTQATRLALSVGQRNLSSNSPCAGDGKTDTSYRARPTGAGEISHPAHTRLGLPTTRSLAVAASEQLQQRGGCSSEGSNKQCLPSVSCFN